MSEQERWSLRSAHMDSFGNAFNKTVGPFGPGMNVVFGPNESGKTTFATFVGGVLYGWPDARGRKNVYRPSNAERSGSLIFENQSGEVKQLQRIRNADGLQGNTELLADLDPDTFKTIFSLNSDELLHLGNASEVTSRLLTAGSGTAISPTAAQRKIDEQIASYTSKAAAAEHSIVNLQNRIDVLRGEVSASRSALQECRGFDLELKELEPALASLSEQYNQLSKKLDRLNALRSSLEAELSQEESLSQEKKQLLQEASNVAQRRMAVEDAFESSASMEIVDAATERAIRDNLDDFQTEQDRLERLVMMAKRDVARSKAQYDLLCAADDQSAASGRGHASKTKRIAFALVFPVFALLLGAFLILDGKATGSQSFMATGLVLMVMSFLLAGAVMVMSLRPVKETQTYEEEFQKVQWVMEQDRLSLEKCQEELSQHQEEVQSFLDHHGLAAAGGSIRRARSLLDEMREARQSADIHQERRQGLVAQIADSNRQMKELTAQRDGLLQQAGCGSLQELDELIVQAAGTKDEVFQELQDKQARAGELRQILASAQDDVAFRRKKLELEETYARLETSKMDFARLLLARRRLADAVSLWEKSSQPEVYESAGRLMAQMTGGKWNHVFLDEDGVVKVISPEGVIRDPLLLSTGTCQQLYLSLRMALLLTVKGVGKSVPILADDILVNFDDDRRVGTAQALLELAKERQIIFLTCHQEIAQLLSSLDDSVRVVAL